jgi:hypothetical protein
MSESSVSQSLFDGRSFAAETDRERVMLAEINRLRNHLNHLVDALSADARHGNLSGRCEDAWETYKEEELLCS